MAILTPIGPADLASFLTEYGIKKYTSYHGVERGSVNSNFVVEIDGERVFLRLYEEQTAEGARRETDLVAWLAAQGIATPAPRARLDGSFVGLLAGKPSAVICHTVKGKGISFAENNLKWHHKSSIKANEITEMMTAIEAAK